jgi:hypothetical protein
MRNYDIMKIEPNTDDIFIEKISILRTFQSKKEPMYLINSFFHHKKDWQKFICADVSWGVGIHSLSHNSTATIIEHNSTIRSANSGFGGAIALGWTLQSFRP